ncbi:MAG: glycoside hydrolase [Bacteroidales bacterium]|nr:glycoside hydrolase [Bacteroidales bacterium]
MKRILYIVTLAAITACSQPPVFDINDFGAIPDGVTDCTAAINAAIESCHGSGGGRVLIPSGEYLTSTIRLLPGVDLHLDEGAVILGSADPETYSSYIPDHDMTRYDSGGNSANANNTTDKRWQRALILAVKADGASISGSGVIDGRHVVDTLGEEGMRGPHTVTIAETSGFTMSGITIKRAANYAVLGYALEDSHFTGLHIMEGWDGIHIRGARRVSVESCRFETGDDSIAGGYWEDMSIRDCDINSSCNGLRLIMPACRLDVSRCRFHGPGVYPHRTSGEARRKNMLFAVSIEPGGWGAAPGELKELYFHDLEIENVNIPFSTSVREGCVARDLTVSDVRATGVYGAMTPVYCWNDNGFETVSISGFSISR